MSGTDARPLGGVRIVELGGIGPGPHAVMIMALLGADVVRIERPPAPGVLDEGTIVSGRRVVVADLKAEADEVAELVDRADVLVEGFRPGVAERLGFGPERCRERNPRLVYLRMTGWGQTGPLAARAGHDINYLSISGALGAIGEHGPVPPLNLVGDYGGGSLFAVVGVLAALLERERTGLGTVVDAAIVDGTSLLMQVVWSLLGRNQWTEQRAHNLLDGGAPYYRCYECADGGWMAVGAIEPPFYAALLKGLGLDELPDRDDPTQWSVLRGMFAATFVTRTRAEWEKVFDDVDACVTPVLSLTEAQNHPQMKARGRLQDRVPGIGALPVAAPLFAHTTPLTLTPSTSTTTPEAIRAWS